MPKREMLINYVPGEECRIALVEDGKLEEFYQERASNESHVGNIYKGRVLNVEPSIQAAFIDFGLERNGFLHITDLHPMYFRGDLKEEVERVGHKTPRRSRPPIQHCLRRGQEIMVQVLKEGIGTKGPTLTSYLSIPGRFLVMMPHMQRLGVSRKVEDDDQRKLMKKLLDDLAPPEEFGFIIRTAGIGRTKAELKRDLNYLLRLWKAMETRKKQVGAVGELYTESDLIIRTIRDVFSNEIDKILLDHRDAAQRARDFIAIASPRSTTPVLFYDDPVPLFHRYRIEEQIERINARTVALPSGGSLVIDQAEALVAIDVNSGRMRDNADAETTAYRTNQEATDEICRQLRLRDLGGVVVSDLIDMRDARHRRSIEQRFRDRLKQDRARTKTLPISQFGILEMTRQRMRPSLNSSLYTDCRNCEAAGRVKNPESIVLDVTRRLSVAMQNHRVAHVDLTIGPDVAFRLLNQKRALLVELEERFGKTVTVRVNDVGTGDYMQIQAFDERGGTVDAEGLDKLQQPRLEKIDPSNSRTAKKGKRGQASQKQAPDEAYDEGDYDDEGEEDQPEADEQQPDDRHGRGEQRSEEGDDSGDGKRRRRRRRRGGRRRRKRGGEESTQQEEAGGDQQAAHPHDKPEVTGQADDRSAADEAKARDGASSEAGPGPEAQAGPDQPGEAEGEEKPKRKPRRSRSKKKPTDAPQAEAGEQPEAGDNQDEAGETAEARPRKKPARKPRKKAEKPESAPAQEEASQSDEPKADGDENETEAEAGRRRRRRGRRGGRRRRKPGDAEAGDNSQDPAQDSGDDRGGSGGEGGNDGEAEPSQPSESAGTPQD